MGRRARATALGASMLLAWLLAATPAWAGIGWIERVRGTVSVDAPGGATRNVAVGDPVEENQTLSTSADGEAVVHFTDNALMVVRPGTQVHLARYQYRENDPGSVSLIRLVRGGMRFVTGLVGHLNRENVKIETVVATIGIRGTDFDTVYRGERIDQLDAGSYTCVTQGGTYMRNSEGKEVDIAQGQTGFITSADLIAKGLAGAANMGLISPPAGLFRSGSFDGEIQHLKDEGMRRIEGKISESLPSQLGAMVPGAVDAIAGLFPKKKKPAAGACAS